MSDRIPNPWLTRGEAQALIAHYKGEVQTTPSSRQAWLAVHKLSRAVAALLQEQRDRRCEQARARKRARR
jgi:hypothetical protein